VFAQDLGLGFLWALIIVAPILLLSLIGTKKWVTTLIVGVTLVVAYGFISWLVFWKTTPIIGFTKVAIYHQYWGLWWLLVVTAVILGVASARGGYKPQPVLGSWIIAIVLVVAAIYGIGFQAVWTDKQAKTLAHQIKVIKESTEKDPTHNYPDTDPDHMLTVSEETADFKANQVLATSRQHNLGTIYRVGAGTLQSVDDHLYWIYGLEPTGFRNSTKLEGMNGSSPGFVVVDAEDPDANAKLMLEDSSGNQYHLEYYLGGYHTHKLERYLWAHGYRDQRVEDLTLEVDDNWHPYYTASLDSVSVGRKMPVPTKMLLIDPTTGKIRVYEVGDGPKEVSNVPDWVDRVYSQHAVEEMLNWWGEWDQAPRNVINEYKANRYKVAKDENPVLVYTRRGHPVWQAIMTSYSKDSAAAYLALFDARDNVVHMYEIPNLTLAGPAAETIKHSTNVKKFDVVHMTLHEIYGQLTWVAPLIKNGGSGGQSASQGLALLRADDLNGGSAVVANNKADALTQYQEKLAAGNNNSGPEENANTKSAAGKVNRVNQLVEGGNSVFYFTLTDDPSHVYRATTGLNGQGNTKLELPLIKIGAQVEVTFLDTGSVRREVTAYDDLGLTISNK
jgi:hypothetical protein